MNPSTSGTVGGTTADFGPGGTAAGQRMGETCLCRELMRRAGQIFGVRSEAARQHLRNSRIELLKAVRSVIDDRISYLSRVEQPGSSIKVE